MSKNSLRKNLSFGEFTALANMLPDTIVSAIVTNMKHMEHEVYIPTAIIGEFEVSATSYIVYILPIKDIARPHLHVGDSQTFPKCIKFHCMIDLLAADYIIRDTYLDHTLDDCQLTAFLRFISSYDEDEDQIWKYIIKTWNINNKNHIIPIDIPIPDYRELAGRKMLQIKTLSDIQRDFFS